jgi:hypothetical protein
VAGTLYSRDMRPHAYGIALLITTLAGCAGHAAPSAEATVTIQPSPSPSPSVALREPHSLVFSATGTAPITSVTAEIDGVRTTARSVKLPWRKVVEVAADGKRHTYALTMKYRTGRVELVAILDGAVVGRSLGQTSGGTGDVSASGDLIG